MKMIFAAAAAAIVSVSAAFAGEFADQCEARLKADGRDPSGCACLEAKVEASASLQKEFQDLAKISDPTERFAAASDEAKAAMTECTRK